MSGLRFAASALGLLLGASLATYPAWMASRGGSAVFLPLTWLGEILVAAALVGVALNTAAGRWAPVERRLFRATLAAFGLSYAVIALAGFDWTGDWLRFAAFRLDLRNERAVTGIGPPEWEVYAWRHGGFAHAEGEAYLVFDPSDRLVTLRPDGTLPGLTCEVAENRPMLTHWRLITTHPCPTRPKRRPRTIPV